MINLRLVVTKQSIALHAACKHHGELFVIEADRNTPAVGMMQNYLILLTGTSLPTEGETIAFEPPDFMRWVCGQCNTAQLSIIPEEETPNV